MYACRQAIASLGSFAYYEGAPQVLSLCHVGAKTLPHECMVLGMCTRFAQYCFGSGLPITQKLAVQFFGVLQRLVHLCVVEASESNLHSRFNPSTNHPFYVLLFLCLHYKHLGMKMQFCSQEFTAVLIKRRGYDLLALTNGATHFWSIKLQRPFRKLYHPWQVTRLSMICISIAVRALSFQNLSSPWTRPWPISEEHLLKKGIAHCSWFYPEECIADFSARLNEGLSSRGSCNHQAPSWSGRRNGGLLCTRAEGLLAPNAASTI